MRLRPSTPIRLQDALDESYDATGRWRDEHDPTTPEEAGDEPGERPDESTTRDTPAAAKRWRPRPRHLGLLLGLIVCGLYTLALSQQKQVSPPRAAAPAAPRATAPRHRAHPVRLRQLRAPRRTRARTRPRHIRPHLARAPRVPRPVAVVPASAPARAVPSPAPVPRSPARGPRPAPARADQEFLLGAP